MKDFSKPYRGVAHFGLWANESADVYGHRDAMAILADAIERSRDVDLRHDQAVTDALDYLDEHGGRLPAVGSFRKALNVQHPVTRRRDLKDAYKRLCASANGNLEVGRR